MGNFSEVGGFILQSQVRDKILGAIKFDSGQKHLWEYDEMIYTNPSTDLGIWVFTGSVLRNNPNNVEFGEVEINTGAVAGNFAHLALSGLTGTGEKIPPAGPTGHRNQVVRYRLTPVGQSGILTNRDLFLGSMIGGGGGQAPAFNGTFFNDPASGVYFRARDGAGAGVFGGNWVAVTSLGGLTETDTGVPASVNTPVVLEYEVQRNPSQVVFKINGAVVATHTTNLNTNQTDWAFYVGNKDANAKGILIDTWLYDFISSQLDAC